MNINRCTSELKDVIRYVQEVLFNEFPSKDISLEYIVTAMFDNKRCHANMVLNNCLTSSNLDEIGNIFISYLQTHSNEGAIQNITPIFTPDVERIFDYAAKELDDNQLIGSEHILLAMLKEENKCTKIIEIFKNIGIDYTFLLSMMHKTMAALKTRNTKPKPKIEPQDFMTPQNDVSKTILSNSTFIQKYTIDLNKQAECGLFDKVIGRDKEVTKIVEVLARRTKNNVVLVGLGGVGKTCIVRHLANLIVQGQAPDILKDKKIIQLNISSMVSGTYLRGAFEERVTGLFNELKQSKKYILFIDDIHTVLKTTTKEKDTDISSMITDILANSDVKVIGTTTFKDYHNAIENNSTISRRLQKIIIEPTTKKETVEILHGIKAYYEDYHNVKYTDQAIEKCVDLSERYVTDRSLPDSAIDVLDFSGAHAALQQTKPQYIVEATIELHKLLTEQNNFVTQGDFDNAEKILTRINSLKSVISDYERSKANFAEKYSLVVDVDDIYGAVTELTNIPISKLSSDEKTNLASINDTLKKYVIGQDEAIDTICKSIKRNKVGLGNPNRLIFSGLLVGKSGTGKTYLAKKLAELIYGDPKALVRIDMSEYSEKSSVSKLIGASAGYIGYDQGGQLTEAIKNKPYCVLLLDEIEKADKEIYNVFLQLLDEGRLTDNSGQLINFKNVIVLMTSNVGVKRAEDFGKGIGFTTDSSTTSRSIIEKEIKTRFMPEFLNRLDQIVYFNDLTDENILDISKIELERVISRLSDLGYHVDYDKEVLNIIAAECIKDRNYGARPIIRFIQNNVEDAITDLILADGTQKNFHISSNDGNILIS